MMLMADGGRTHAVKSSGCSVWAFRRVRFETQQPAIAGNESPTSFST